MSGLENVLGKVTERSQLGAKAEAENCRWFSCLYDNVKPKKREFSHSVVCLAQSENYVLENGALCLEKAALTVPIQYHTGLFWKLGLTAFAEVSEALFAVE